VRHVEQRCNAPREEEAKVWFCSRCFRFMPEGSCFSSR
jgi:hypothetical protein